MTLFKQFLLDYIADYGYNLKFDQLNILLELSNQSKLLINDEDVLNQLFYYQNNLIEFKVIKTNKNNKGIILEKFPKESFIQFQKEKEQKKAIKDIVDLMDLTKIWSFLKNDYLNNQYESHLLKILTNSSYFSQHILISFLKQKEVKKDVLSFFKNEKFISNVNIEDEDKNKGFIENKIPLLNWVFANELYLVSHKLLKAGFSIETKDQLGNTIAFYTSNKRHLNFLNKYQPNWFHINNLGKQCLNYLVENKKLKNEYGLVVDLNKNERVTNAVLDEALDIYRLKASFFDNSYKDFCDIFNNFKNPNNIINQKIKGYHWLYGMDLTEMDYVADYAKKIHFLCRKCLDLSQTNDVDNTMLASYLIKNIKQLKCNNSTNFIFNHMHHQNNFFNTTEDYDYFIKDIFLTNSLEMISLSNKNIFTDNFLENINIEKKMFGFAYKSYPQEKWFLNFLDFAYPSLALKQVYNDILSYSKIHIEKYPKNLNKSIGEYIWKTSLVVKGIFDISFSKEEKNIDVQLFEKIVKTSDINSLKWIFLENCLNITIMDEWFDDLENKTIQNIDLDNFKNNLLLDLNNLKVDEGIFKSKNNLDWIVFSNLNYFVSDKEFIDNLPEVINITKKRIEKTNDEDKTSMKTLNKTKQWLEYNYLKGLEYHSSENNKEKKLYKKML